MSHEDIVFNGANFVDNAAKHLILKDTSPAFWGIINDLFTPMNDIAISQGLNQSVVNEYLGSFKKESNPLISWDKFVDNFFIFIASKKYPLATDAIARNFTLTILRSTPKYDMDKSLVDLYRHLMVMGPATAIDDPVAGEWTTLDAALVDKIDVLKQAKYAFDHFAESFRYVPNATSLEFFGDLTYFLQTTAFLKADTQITYVVVGNNTTDSRIPSYEEIFKGFFGNTYNSTVLDNNGKTELDRKFNERLAKFYIDKTDITKEGGSLFFIPSHYFDEWMEELRSEYITMNIVSSVNTGDASKLLVIDRILKLLISMVGTMQRITAAQAERLNFLTSWQEAYTQLLNQIPTYVLGGDHPISGSGDPDSGSRAELNPAMQALSEKVRALRGTVQDSAKQMQSTVNQSQDAANQQVQMGTALLQQLSTILSQIYR